MILQRITAAILALLTLSSALIVWNALSNGETPLPGAPPFQLAAGENRLADRLLDGHPGAAEFTRARIASKAALREAPYDTSALLRLAYIDQLQNGTLGGGGVEALRQSYERVRFDRAVGFWRIRFALENWQDIPLDLRLKVQQEVFVLASDPGHRWPLRFAFDKIHNPYGAIVASFWRAQVAAMQK